MRERLCFDIEGAEKKALIKALENEQKFRRAIPIIDKDGEKIADTSKWDNYTTYIDFWLSDFIDDGITQKRGFISKIETYEYMTQKGVPIKRIKNIIA